jgi:hypothetical protein
MTVMAAVPDGADRVTPGSWAAVPPPDAALATTVRSLDWTGDATPPAARDTSSRHRTHAPASVPRRSAGARPLVSEMAQAAPRASATAQRSSARGTSRPAPSAPPRDLSTTSAVTSASGGAFGTGSGAAWTGMLVAFALGTCLLTGLLPSSRRWRSTIFVLLPERPG